MAVYVPAVGTFDVGTSAVAGDSTFDAPTATVTSPTGVVSTGGPNLTVTWSYSQAQGKPQTEY
ncbi:MAG: hypothetical protein D6746_08800, partial [Bacteroidetes bacterium]